MRDRDRRLVAVHRGMLALPARQAGALGFLPRCMVTGLPYRPVRSGGLHRRTGRLDLTLRARPGVGLPYGRYPRLLLLRLCTRALRTGSREVRLGTTTSACMRRMGLMVTGGRHGTLRRFRDQAERLFTTRMVLRWRDPAGPCETSFRLLAGGRRWWRRPAGAADGRRGAGCVVELSPAFFTELTARPVPVDLRACHALRSPLALDVYAWLCARLFGLRRGVAIGWPRLHAQFGTQTRRWRDFRRAFLRVLPEVLTVYPAARVRQRDGRLLLLPSPPSVHTRP